MTLSKVKINGLLEKLIEIEQAIGVETNAVLRNKVCEAQDIVLQWQSSDCDKHADPVDPSGPEPN